MPYDAAAIDAQRRARAGAAGAVRTGRLTFDEIEAARMARDGKTVAPFGRRVRVPGAAPPSAEWLAKFRGPFPANASTRAQRTCGLCGSREHDRRNHARAIEQETPTGILPVAPAAVDPTAEPAVAFQEKARAIADKRGDGRAVTIPVTGATLRERRSLALTVLAPEDEALRPLTRGDCANVPRPCPFVSCQFHLYLDVNSSSGSIKINHPGKEPWELAETCALDVADKGSSTLADVGNLIGVTRERIRQMETRGIAALRRVLPDAAEPDTHGPVSFNRYAIETP